MLSKETIQKLVKVIVKRTKEDIDVVLKRKNSNLSESVDVKVMDNSFQIYLNDYYKFVESGRKKFSKRVPITAILKWCSEVGIVSNNRVAFAIQTAIFKRGIKKRPFIDSLINDLAEVLEKELMDIFTKEIEERWQKI